MFRFTCLSSKHILPQIFVDMAVMHMKTMVMNEIVSSDKVLCNKITQIDYDYV